MNALAMSTTKDFLDLNSMLYNSMSKFHELIYPEQKVVKAERDKKVQKLLNNISKANKLFEQIDFSGMPPNDAEIGIKVFDTLLIMFDDCILNLEKSQLLKTDKTEVLEGMYSIRNHIAESIEALEIYADEDVMSELKLFANA